MEHTSFEKLQELKEFFYKETGNYPSSATTSIMISNIALQEQIEKLKLHNYIGKTNIEEILPKAEISTLKNYPNGIQSFFNGSIALLWNTFLIAAIIAIAYFFLILKSDKNDFKSISNNYEFEEYKEVKTPPKKLKTKSVPLKPFLLEESEFYKAISINSDSLFSSEIPISY